MYDPQASRKGGLRKHLIEILVKEVEAHKAGKPSEECMVNLFMAVRRYQKEASK